MSLLQEIMDVKATEVARRKMETPVTALEASEYFGRPCRSLKAALQNSTVGIIAEIKRRSPSRGVMNLTAPVAEIASAYAAAGAAGISVLTDGPFFGGSNEDLTDVRQVVEIPMLRKDFLCDAYQVIEAKAIGADVVLLIAAVLEPVLLQELAQVARSLGLETLLEVHSRTELDRYLSEDISLVGVNSRNLGTLHIEPSLHFELAEAIPSTFVRIAESGLKDPEDVLKLREAGYQGFLMGERFMTAESPGDAIWNFVTLLEAKA